MIFNSVATKLRKFYRTYFTPISSLDRCIRQRDAAIECYHKLNELYTKQFRSNNRFASLPEEYFTIDVKFQSVLTSVYGRRID